VSVRGDFRRTLVIRALLIALVALTALAVPSGAGAVSYLNPPGSSGITQYTEVVPTATGSTPTGSLPAGAASTATPASPFSRFVAGTSPVRPGATPRPLPPGGGSAGGSVEQALAGGGGGLGLGLPLILGAAAAGALGLLVIRRRRS
jgi:hypothetical protein